MKSDLKSKIRLTAFVGKISAFGSDIFRSDITGAKFAVIYKKGNTHKKIISRSARV
jgi:uncharacterized protein (DUF342 family)